MNQKSFKPFLSYLWFNLMVLSYLLFSYYFFDGWWYSSIGTTLILFFSFLLWGKGFLSIVGLILKAKTVLLSVLFTVVIILVSWVMMSYIGSKNGLAIETTGWKNYYHDVFYILNEEIIVGAITLYFLVNKWKLKPLLASALLGVAFSLIHFAFYKWIFNDRGIISIATLTTLFLVGFVRNNLILQTGHIAYSWALHFGWMVVMFGCHHIDIGTNKALSELERFNIFMGSTEMLLTSLFLAIGSMLHWFLKHKNTG